MEFFLNVFTEYAEFSDKNICHYSKRDLNLLILVLETGGVTKEWYKIERRTMKRTDKRRAERRMDRPRKRQKKKVFVIRVYMI